MGVSPSSSMSSFEPTSVSPRSRSSTGGIIGNNPMHMTTFGPAVPPKKPPRRNLSVSPTHIGQHFSYTSPNHQQQPLQNQQQQQRQHRSTPTDSPYSHQSHSSVGGMSFDETQLRDRQRGDRLYASARESTRSTSGISISSSNDMLDERSNEQCNEPNVPNHTYQEETRTIKKPIPTPRNISKDIIKCENPTLKSYNPSRKLKRNRNSYSISLGDTEQSVSSGSNSDQKADIPSSPTNYKQPPTPDHPPPSSSQAERTIHERIRPLSQEYKRRSALINQQQLLIDSCTSPNKFLPDTQPDPFIFRRSPTTASIESVNAYQATNCVQGSSGSLSSNVSCSDQSGSTDNVEELITDTPFAGLLKGSSVNRRHNSNNSIIVKYQRCSSAPDAEHQQKPRIKPPISTKPVLPEKKIIRHLTQPKYSDNEENKRNGNESENGVSYNDLCAKENANNEKKEPIKDNGSRQSFNSNHDEQQESSNEDTTTTGTSQESSILSPFNAEEARKKISEIIESFGSGILNSNLTPTNEIELDFDDMVVPPERHELALRLRHARLLHLERILFENGYDNFKFMNGVLDESDIEIMQIPEGNGSKLLKFVKSLPAAEFQPQIPLKPNEDNRFLNNDIIDTQKGVGTLNQWLCSINLPEYLETFNKHLYNNLDSVCGVWDVELQTVLEINKVGHRRRILQSLAYMRQMREPKVIKTPLGENNDNNKPVDSPMDTVKEAQTQQRTLVGYRKNRPAPPPPTTKKESLPIRGPAELLLNLPSNLRTKWRHSANVLLHEKIKYDVLYLGSTVVKELQGTESTRKSIQKLKRVQRNSTNSSSSQQKTNSRRPLSKCALVRLAISHCGVEFIDVNNERTICEHEIQNINCACQDADDLRHFAYITKEDDLHYCHVFSVESTDLAKDIILTLGQAFEVAYQLALREGSDNTTFPQNHTKVLQDAVAQK